ALALFQLGPWRSRRCGWPYEFERYRIKIDMDLFSRPIRKIKHVCVSEGFHCEQRSSGWDRAVYDNTSHQAVLGIATRELLRPALESVGHRAAEAQQRQLGRMPSVHLIQ